jgi:RNA polymerase sigma-70 factor (ECF subfamily)
MLGSGFEAEDAVQETFLKAVRFGDSFEGRSSVRSWLYRVATNVCTDMQRGAQRRARPMELGPASPPDESRLGPLEPEALWVSPIEDDRILPDTADPAEITVARESIRLAFVTALQHLPARQRAALILCDVLRWQASEAAELLDTSVAAVNSALQRARATMAALPAEARPLDVPSDNAELLARYVAAFESYDIDSFVSLLHEDAIQSMPPYSLWLQGRDNLFAWWLGPGIGCKGSKLVPVGLANGMPAWGQYKPAPDGGREPWALIVPEVSDGRIVELTFFLDTKALFPLFGLPDHLD